jgi:hypothetical protein
LINECAYRGALDGLSSIASDPSAIGDPAIRGDWLTRRAWIAYYVGDIGRAIDDLRAVVELGSVTGEPSVAVHAHHFLGRAIGALADLVPARRDELLTRATSLLEASSSGLTRVGTDEQVGYGRLREAQVWRRRRDRTAHRDHLAQAVVLFGGGDATWHAYLEAAADPDLRPNARRNRAEHALFGAWRQRYPRGVSAGHARLAELVAEPGTSASFIQAADHLVASIAALPRLGTVDHRPEQLRLSLQAAGWIDIAGWHRDASERLAQFEGVFSTLRVLRQVAMPSIATLTELGGEPQR